MATMSIEDALAGATFDNKDEFVAALRAAAVTDPQRVYRYGGYALLRVPMGERESKSFIDTKLKPHDAKLTSDDADVLTSLADFVEALRAKVPLATAGAAGQTPPPLPPAASTRRRRWPTRTPRSGTPP